MKHVLNVSVGCCAWDNYVHPHKVNHLVWAEIPEGKIPVIVTVDVFWAINGRIACCEEELDKIIKSGENTHDYFLVPVEFAISIANDRDSLARDLEAGGLLDPIKD